MGTMNGMPRKSTLGPSVVITVRVPAALGKAVKEAAGSKDKEAEWLRNQLRHAVGVPVDKEAGYDEGWRAGWTNSSQAFRRALKSAS